MKNQADFCKVTFLQGMAWCYQADYLTIADQATSDSLIWDSISGRAEILMKLKSQLGDVGLSISSSILGLLSCFLTEWMAVCRNEWMNVSKLVTESLNFQGKCVKIEKAHCWRENKSYKLTENASSHGPEHQSAFNDRVHAYLYWTEHMHLTA